MLAIFWEGREGAADQIRVEIDGDGDVPHVGGPTKQNLTQDERKILGRARDPNHRKRQREEGREEMATLEAWGKGEVLA